MTQTLRITLLALLLALSAGLPAAEAPTEFDRYWMVFLLRGDNPPELDAEASAKLQSDHLDHLGKLFNEGHALAAGPFTGGPAETMRGIVLFPGDYTEAEVREMAAADPAVTAGRLKVKVIGWATGADALDFPLYNEIHGSGPES